MQARRKGTGRQGNQACHCQDRHRQARRHQTGCGKVRAGTDQRETRRRRRAGPRKELFIMATTTEFTDKLQTTFKDAAEKAKAAFEKSQGAFGEAGEFAKGNVEALVESSKILASGLQELGKGYVSEGKASFETMSAEIKELASQVAHRVLRKAERAAAQAVRRGRRHQLEEQRSVAQARQRSVPADLDPRFASRSKR
jgi:hypothetical protein